MLNYECKVETKSPIRRELTISVKPDSVRQYIDDQVVELQKKAKIKGFRQGKVPLNVIRQRFMADAKSDAFSKLIQDSYVRAIEENKIVAIGSPRIEPKTSPDLKEGEALTYVATVEIYPEIQLSNLSKIKITRPSAETSDDEMKQSLENLRRSQAEMIPMADHEGPVKKDDHVEMSFSGTLDGKEEEGLSGKNRLVKVGAGSYLEDFENALLGMKKGESKTFSLTFPKDYSSPKMAGKTVEFTVTVHEFKREQLPELDDDFARRFKMEGILDLRKKVADNLKEQKEEESRRKVRDNLLQALLESHTFEVPRQFIDTQLEFVVNETARSLSSRGFTNKMIQDYLEKNKEPIIKRAEDQVRVSLILDKVATDQQIKVGTEDVERELARISEQQSIPLERVKEALGGEQAQRQMRFRLKEERATDYLLAQVKITDEKAGK